MVKILVDTLGGDRSPDANIEGGITALNNNKDIQIIFVGDKAVIEEKLKAFTYDKERVFIEIENQAFSCCPFIMLLHSLAPGVPAG